jgi:hypothetical protein
MQMPQSLQVSALVLVPYKIRRVHLTTCTLAGSAAVPRLTLSLPPGVHHPSTSSRVLSRFTSVKHLILKSAQLPAITLLGSSAVPRQLLTLDLSYSRLGVSHGPVLGEALYLLDSLTFLDLRGSRLRASVRHLGEALADGAAPRLERLVLRDAGLKARELCCLLEGVEGRTSFAHVDLSENGMVLRGTTEEVGQLAEALGNSVRLPGLRGLDLRRDDMSRVGSALAHALISARPSSLVRLLLEQPEEAAYAEDCIVPIVAAVTAGALVGLVDLYIRVPQFLNIRSLMAALRSGACPGLKRLALPGCALSRDALTVLAEALTGALRGLQSLVLPHARWLAALELQEGVVAVVEAIMSVPGGSELRQLELKGMGTGGATILMRALEAGALRRLTWLGLSCCAIGSAAAELLVCAVGGNALPALDYLNLSNNPVPASALDGIAEALQDGALPRLRRLVLADLRHFRLNVEECLVRVQAVLHARRPRVEINVHTEVVPFGDPRGRLGDVHDQFDSEFVA